MGMGMGWIEMIEMIWEWNGYDMGIGLEWNGTKWNEIVINWELEREWIRIVLITKSVPQEDNNNYHFKHLQNNNLCQ